MLDKALKIIGIIGQCEKDQIMLDYLKDKTQKILLMNAYGEYEQLTQYSKLDLLIISNELNIESLDPVLALIVDNAKAHDVEIISNIELIYKYKKPRTIAVTGSYSKNLLARMISHSLTRFGVAHYFCMEKTFKWPENLETIDLLILSLENHHLKSLDIFYATIGIVTNIESERLEGLHISEYLNNVRHFLKLTQKQILHVNSNSGDLLKDFPTAVKIDTDKIQSHDDRFKKHMSVFTAHAITTIMDDQSYFGDTMFECMKYFTIQSNMQVLFKNDEVSIIDNSKAMNIEQILYGIQLCPDDVKIVLICPEPADPDLWEKMKSKRYLTKIRSIVVFDTMESKLLKKFEYTVKVVNAVTFDYACLQAMKMFNHTRQRPMILMLISAPAMSKDFQNIISECLRNGQY